MDARWLAVAVALAGFAPTPSTDPGITISVEVRSPVLGELRIEPPSGTDTTAITVTTSAGCATPSDGFSVLLFGPGPFERGVPVHDPTGTGFSTTAPIIAALQRTLAEAADALDTTLVAGTYRLALVCQDRAANTASGMFVGALYLTSPTAYRTTPLPLPTTTSTAAPAAGGSGSGGGLSHTGAAVGTLIVAGLLLAGGGIAFVLLSRRRAGPTIRLNNKEG